MLNKKILAVAVASAFAGGAYAANVSLVSSGATAPSTKYASELPTGTSLGNTDAIVGATGWGWSSGTSVYIRYDLGASATFTADPTAAVCNAGGNIFQAPVSIATCNNAANVVATVTKASGGAASSSVIFQATATDNRATTLANTALQMAGVKKGSGQTTITMSIYDTSSNAVAAGSTGRLATSNAILVDYTPAVSFTVTQGTTATAEVSNNYKAFTNDVATKALGNVVLENSTTVLNDSGTAGLNILTITGATTQLTVSGDFSAVAGANGVYDAASLARVFFGSASCGTSVTAANSLTATTATFAARHVGGGTVAGGNGTLCVTMAGNNAIPVSSYTVAYTPVGVSGNSVSAVAATTIGSIARNGGQLTTPWMTTNASYVSRIVLSNNSGTAATYAVAVKGEEGNTVTANATGATGTVPANGMVTINASDLVTGVSDTTKTRFAATITFAVPRTSIDGVVQTINPSSGSVSTTTLVAPGSN